MVKERDEFLDMKRFSLDRLNFQAVFFAETHENVVVCLREVVHDTVDI